MSGYPGFSGIRIGIMHRNYGLGGAATWGAPHIRVQAYPAFGVHSSFRVRTDLECALFGGAQISGTRSFLKWRTISGAGLPRHVGISGIFRDSHRNYAPAFGGALFLQGAHRFGVRTLWGCRNIWNTFFLCRVPEVSAAACAAHLRCRPLPACRST